MSHHIICLFFFIQYSHLHSLPGYVGEVCVFTDSKVIGLFLRGWYASYEAFTAVMFQIQVFWLVTPCSVVVGYQCF